MASFLYQCADGHHTVVSRSVWAEEIVPKCESCGKTTIRIWSPPPISFKGSGWGHQ